MSSDEEDGDNAAGPPKAKNLGLRIQKKLMGMAVKSKGAAKNFIDEESGEILDSLHEIALKYSGDVKVAKKQLKDLIKIAVKLGLLYRHGQFNDEELGIGRRFQSKFKMAALTMISYHDVAFTFDASFLSDVMTESKSLLKSQINRHLTKKSHGRVDNVFNFFGSEDLLTKLYTDPEYKDLLDKFYAQLSPLVEKL